MLIIWSTYKNSIRRNRSAKKGFVVRKAVFLWYIKLVCNIVSSQFITFNNRNEPCLLGMLFQIMQISTHTITDSNCNN